MAYLIDTIRDRRHFRSIAGRNLMLSKDQTLVGFVGYERPIEDISTTVATSLANYGHSNFTVSGSSQLSANTLQSPMPGVEKTISLISTSTGNQIVRFTDAVCYTASGGSGTTCVNLKGFGASISLIGLSTGVWLQTNNPSTAMALVLFSTST